MILCLHIVPHLGQEAGGRVGSLFSEQEIALIFFPSTATAYRNTYFRNLLNFFFGYVLCGESRNVAVVHNHGSAIGTKSTQTTLLHACSR